jgi:hypothetical protein
VARQKLRIDCTPLARYGEAQPLKHASYEAQPKRNGPKRMSSKRTIVGRPIGIEELAEPLPRMVYNSMVSRYTPGDVEATIDYLLSDTPLDEALWFGAKYEAIPYEVAGEQRTLYTNSHSEGCVRDILRGSFDLSEYIANLSRILHLEIQDRERLRARLIEIATHLESGTRKEVI